MTLYEVAENKDIAQENVDTMIKTYYLFVSLKVSLKVCLFSFNIT